MELLLVEVSTPSVEVSWTRSHLHSWIKVDRLLRQFQYEQGMPGGRGRKPFTPMDTNPTSIRNMLLGLEMADWVDQSFVKVHFHGMSTDYSNWLVNKIANKEADMVAMRKQFLRDNWERHKANNYEFKRRDNDDKVPNTDGINEQPKEKRLRTKWSSYFWLWTSLV